MHPGQGEFRPLFLHAVLSGHGVHAKSTLQHQTLADLNLALELLGKVSPTHNLEFPGWVTISQGVKPNGHFADWSLVVLGIPNGRSIYHLHFQHAVVHGLHRFRGTS